MTSYQKLKEDKKNLFQDIHKLLYGNVLEKAETELYYRFIFDTENYIMKGTTTVKQQTI